MIPVGWVSVVNVARREKRKGHSVLLFFFRVEIPGHPRDASARPKIDAILERFTKPDFEVTIKAFETREEIRS